MPANQPTSAPSSPSSSRRSRTTPADDAPIATAEAIQIAALREALRVFLRESELIARASGLTPQQHLLLLLIKGTPDGSEQATVTQLAARLRLAQQTVTDLAARAEKAGLIKRQHTQRDARVTILHLTAEGERRLARSVRTHAPERERLRAALKDLMA